MKEDDVRSAIEAIENDNRVVSVRSVLKQLGSGSMTDVSSALRKIRSEKTALAIGREMLPEPIKAHLDSVAIELWKAAKEDAASATEALRRDAADRIDVAESQALEMAQAVDLLEGEMRASRELLDQCKQELDRTLRERDEALHLASDATKLSERRNSEISQANLEIERLNRECKAANERIDRLINSIVTDKHPDQPAERKPENSTNALMPEIQKILKTSKKALSCSEIQNRLEVHSAVSRDTLYRALRKNGQRYNIVAQDGGVFAFAE